jgi:hypothetical protein
MKLRDPRTWTTVLTTVALLLGSLAILVAVLSDWKFGLKTDDKAVVVNTVIAAVSCAFVAVAGAVALLAYLSASGRPDLDIEITFHFSFPNAPVFSADDSESHPAGWRKILAFKQVLGTVQLKNSSTYAARNPGVRIELEGLGGLQPQEGWESLTFVSTVGLTTIQWDGEIIHGRWSKTLPALDFAGVDELVRGAAALVVTIAADGVSPVTKRMPVRVLSNAEYEEYTAERGRILENAAES